MGGRTKENPAPNFWVFMQLPPCCRVINVLGRSERLCLIPATRGGGSGIDGLGD